MKKENIIVSACLLGSKCRYDGGHKFNEQVHNLKAKYNLIPICPEILCGMKSPRPAAEIKNGCVLEKNGKDVTHFFTKGAEKALEIAQKNNCRMAILKTKSPSCGKGKTYDGTFTGNTIEGNGITAKLLMDNGIECYTQEELTNIRS